MRARKRETKRATLRPIPTFAPEERLRSPFGERARGMVGFVEVEGEVEDEADLEGGWVVVGGWPRPRREVVVGLVVAAGAGEDGAAAEVVVLGLESLEVWGGVELSSVVVLGGAAEEAGVVVVRVELGCVAVTLKAIDTPTALHPSFSALFALVVSSLLQLDSAQDRTLDVKEVFEQWHLKSVSLEHPSESRAFVKHERAQVGILKPPV